MADTDIEKRMKSKNAVADYIGLVREVTFVDLLAWASKNSIDHAGILAFELGQEGQITVDHTTSTYRALPVSV